MCPCFGSGGLQGCYNGYTRIPNERPILGDHRIDFRPKGPCGDCPLMVILCAYPSNSTDPLISFLVVGTTI